MCPTTIATAVIRKESVFKLLAVHSRIQAIAKAVTLLGRLANFDRLSKQVLTVSPFSSI